MDIWISGYLDIWISGSQPRCLDASKRSAAEAEPINSPPPFRGAIRDADFTAKASSISVPTTCVVGEYDGATNPELVEGTAKLIPGSKFEVIKNAGHIPCAEQPKEIIQIIREMIAII